MIKLIVSDFDGTLLPYGQKTVSDGVVKRIKDALGRGIRVAVSSGRTYGELEKELLEFRDELYFICCDGAYCVKSGKAVYQRKIETSDLAFFFDKSAAGLSFVLHGAFENYSVGRLPAEADIFCAKPVNFLTDVKEKIFKITSYGAEVKLAPTSGLRTHWDGGENKSAQFVNRFADKGVALSDLQTRLMLTKFDTACIGDSGNDLPMVRGSKYSFAVSARCSSLAAAVTNNVSSAEEAFDALLL